MEAAARRAEFVERDAVLISKHARDRMFERNISTDEVMDIVASGEVIEEDPHRIPCPSAVILGFINHIAYHVVVAFCLEHLVVITAYFPKEEKWVEHRRRR